MCALIAVVADIDLEAIGEGLEIHLVCTENENHFRLGGHDILHPALLCEAEHQPAHPRGGEMQRIHAVPAIFDAAEPLRGSEHRMECALGKCRTAHDHCRTFGRSESFGHLGRQVLKQ